MPCQPLPSIDGVNSKIAELEESAHVIADLANCLPDHSEWLWRLADRLAAEAAELQSQAMAG